MRQKIKLALSKVLRTNGEIALILTVFSAVLVTLGLIAGVQLNKSRVTTESRADQNSSKTQIGALDTQSCPTTSTNTYQTIEINPNVTPPHPSPNAEQDPDINLAVRGYTPTNASLGLVEVGGPQDSNAPQLTNLVSVEVPSFVNAYQVYDWIWPDNRKGSPISDPSVTLLGLAATPGESIKLPNSGYKIDSTRDLQATVLFANENSLTLKYTLEDNIVDGYAVHLDGICTDPNLLALYTQSNASGRVSLPAVKGNQPVGTAKTGEVKLVIRDKGSFMDPRVRKSWWQQITPTQGPIPTSGGNTNPPTPTQQAGGNPTNPPANPTQPNNPNPTGGNNNQQGGGALEIRVMKRDTDGEERLWQSSDGRAQVSIRGPAPQGRGFSVVMDVPTTTGTCRTDPEYEGGLGQGIAFACEPGVIFWRGAPGADGNYPGTVPGGYSVQIALLPECTAPNCLAPTPNPNPSTQVRSGQTTQVSLIVVSSDVPFNPPDQDDNDIEPTIAGNGYGNRQFEDIMDQYRNEEISPLQVSTWLTNASRVPGLQKAVCYPPRCTL